jgi:serine protease
MIRIGEESLTMQNRPSKHPKIPLALQRFHLLHLATAFLVLFLALPGCGGSGSSTPPPTGTVSGKLIVPPDNTTEVEPNDSPTQAQVVSSFLNVSGNASQADPGFTLPGSTPLTLVDLYSLNATGPVRITLTIAQKDPIANDLDLFLLDPSGNQLDVSAGYVSTEFLETKGAGSFLIGVQAFRGSTAYVLSIAPLGGIARSGSEPIPPGAEFVPGEVVVKLRKDASGVSRKADLFAARHQLVQKQSLPGEVELMMVQGPSHLEKSTGDSKSKTSNGDDNALKALTWDTIQRLQRDPEVEYVQANFIRRPLLTPNDTHYPKQWDFPSINLPQAWDITTGSDNIIVAVIDTGVLPNHPDLQGRLIEGYDFISDPTNAGDGDGIDANATDVGDDPKGQKSSFHGTHVAGTIGAATNNGIGVAGVTWATKIMPLRVLGRGGGPDTDISQAILYAAGLPNSSGTVPPKRANIINMSLGGAGSSPAMQDAVTRARQQGVIIVAAAGNENTSAPSVPASLDGVISVSAVDVQGQKAPYSNFGRTVDVAAPGGNASVDLNGDNLPDGILSTIGDDDGTFAYRFYQGTSMASPHVAGVIALMLAVNPNLTPDDIDQLLAGTRPGITRRITRDLGLPGRDDVYGHGLIDASQAVLAAKETAGTGGGATGPILTLSTSSLDFSNYINTLPIGITNAGIGTLTITEITDDADWLTVTPASGTAPVTVNAAVNRSGLANGEYSATITVKSDAPAGGTASVTIRMSVGGPTEGNVGTVFVLVVNQNTEAMETVAQGETSPAQGYAFTIPKTLTGTYLIVAGTDRDDDGLICDIEDACGFFQELVTVAADQERPGVDILIGELASPQSAKLKGEEVQRRTFKRLH